MIGTLATYGPGSDFQIVQLSWATLLLKTKKVPLIIKKMHIYKFFLKITYVVKNLN